LYNNVAIHRRNALKTETKIERKMKKFYFIYFIIIASIALMIYNISELDFNNLKKGPFAGIVSNVLLILAMLITIRDIKKKENK
jgi:hypothetical protein